MLNIKMPFEHFFGLDGAPLDAGYVYVGTAGLNPEVHPMAVYWDVNLTLPAAQPLRTSNGYIVNGSAPAVVYTSATSFSVTVRDKNSVLVISLLDATGMANLQGLLAASNGASMVGFVQPGAGAVATTVQDQLRKITILADNFIAVGDVDDAVGINRALQYAKTLVAARTLQGEGGAWVHPYGGAEVVLSARNYVTTSATVEIPQNVILRGSMGKGSTITSSFNGQVIRNEDDYGITYGCVAGGLCDLRVFGDVTQPLQTGVDLLRMLQGATFHNVEVAWCGGDGVVLRECIMFAPRDIDTHDNIKAGLILYMGVTSWATMAMNNLPCNACNLTAITSSSNGDMGVSIALAHNNTIQGMFQYNGKKVGTLYPYQVRFETEASGNSVQNSWLEGHCTALVSSNAAVGNRNYVRFCHFTNTGNALTGPARAVIADRGDVLIEGYDSEAVAWPTVAGSTAPFRCTPAAVGRIEYKGPGVTGLAADGMVIEDTAGNRALLTLYARQEIDSSVGKVKYGTEAAKYDWGFDVAQYYKTTALNSTTWETTPWMSISGWLQGIEFDHASAGQKAGLYFRRTTPEGFVSSYPGSICISGGGSNANAYLKVKAYDPVNPWNGWLPLASNKKGSGALVAAGAGWTNVIADTAVLATSVIIVTPTNVGAGVALTGYAITAKVPGVSFSIYVPGATAGGEPFDYVIIN